MRFNLNTKGKGIWQFLYKLSSHPEFVMKLNKIIKDIFQKYSIDSLSLNDQDNTIVSTDMTINPNLMLDLIQL